MQSQATAVKCDILFGPINAIRKWRLVGSIVTSSADRCLTLQRPVSARPRAWVASARVPATAPMAPRAAHTVPEALEEEELQSKGKGDGRIDQLVSSCAAFRSIW